MQKLRRQRDAAKDELALLWVLTLIAALLASASHWLPLAYFVLFLGVLRTVQLVRSLRLAASPAHPLARQG